MIADTADRPGFSFFNAAANANTSGGVRGWDCRAGGTSASNPPSRHCPIQRSSVHRVIRTVRPSGSVCGWPASRRTNAPR
jgi:hypothetical protein